MAREAPLFASGGRGDRLEPEEFLANLCAEKAGLPADCWRHPEVELFTYGGGVKRINCQRREFTRIGNEWTRMNE